MMSTTLLLLNLSTMHGVIHTFMDELFSLLWNKLLPKNNKNAHHKLQDPQVD